MRIELLFWEAAPPIPKRSSCSRTCSTNGVSQSRSGCARCSRTRTPSSSTSPARTSSPGRDGSTRPLVSTPNAACASSPSAPTTPRPTPPTRSTRWSSARARPATSSTTSTTRARTSRGRLGSARTPEAFVFDADRRLVYHGAVDDNREEADVTTHYLRDAIKAALAGEAPEIADTPPVGCTVKWRS